MNTNTTNIGIKPTCEKCGFVFNSYRTFEKHLRRKIPCDRVLDCKRCNKVFKQIGHLTRHQNRQNSCNPIKGEPTKRVAPNTCIYCRKRLSNKSSLTRHHGICAVRNGRVDILFDEIKRMKKRETGRNNIIAKRAEEVKRLKETKLHDHTDTDSPSKGLVYFVRMGGSNMFKIGYTTNLKSRMSTMQTGCPLQLSVYRKVPHNDPRQFEQYLHECFDNNNIRGEWFNLTEQAIDTFVDHLQNLV